MDLCQVSTPFLNFKHESLSDYAKKHGIEVEFQRKDIVYEPGELTESFWYLESGQVKNCFYNHGGEERTMLVLEAGSILGEGLLLSAKPSTLYCIAESYSILYEIPKDTFWKLFQEDFHFQRLVLDSLNGKFLVVRKAYEEVTSLPAKERLTNLLLASINEEREYQEGWYFLKNKYNNKELASILGVSSLTISRMLSELEKQDLIKTVSRNIVVRKHEPNCVKK